MRLRKHGIILQGDRVVLRPMTENDWSMLLKWNSNPGILYFTEGDEVASYTLEQIQQMYRSISQQAFCFIIEFEGQPIGECWLQRMNLDRVLERHPGRDCRRIDLMIGEKDLWGQGLGTDVICALTKFGFEKEHADLIFGCDVADHNPRSLRAFQKAGYEIDARIERLKEGKVQCAYDVANRRR